MEEKTILYLCVIVILTMFAGFQSQSIDLPTAELPTAKILSIAKKKCLKNAPNGKSSKLQMALMELQVCLVEYEFPKAAAADPDPSMLLNEICINVRNYTYHCITTFSKQIQPCLDPEEQYLPEFLLNAYNDTFNSLCENGGIDLQSRISSFNNGTCTELSEDIEGTFLSDCVAESNLVKDLHQSDYLAITKKHLCQDIETVYTCAANKMRKHCGNDTNYEEDIDIISNIYLNQCGNVTENEN